ncbi:hypothetical protein TNCV_1938691 [Trichonephila clavipes]|nr:hypothetical protein TNCV_1938691 [Trichonephila clavipes]
MPNSPSQMIPGNNSINQPNTYPKTCSWSSEVTAHAENRYNAVVVESKINRHSWFLWPMVAAIIGNIMFRDEFTFALQPGDKRVRVWTEQDQRNRPKIIIEHNESRVKHHGSYKDCFGIRCNFQIYRRGSVTV